MKKLVFGIALVAMVTVASCAQRTDPALNGTWVIEGAEGAAGVMASMLGEIEWRFDNGNFEIWGLGFIIQRGTYTTSNGTITTQVTHVDWTGGDGLLDRAGLRALIIAEEGSLPTEAGELIDRVFATDTSTYIVSDDTFRITSTVAGETSTVVFRRSGYRPQHTVTDPAPPFIGTLPVLQWFTGIGTITTQTRDTPAHTVIVEVQLGLDKGDTETLSELFDRQEVLRDFTRRYFAMMTVEELRPENETRLRREFMEILNTRYLDNARIRNVSFERLDVMENS